ncbi:MAG TPA: UDP-2,3-diacylglucosamine diphosphatase [bacterium]|nr:UDP-2,3-diacylglucosamine diphosphatase [bacterium]
MSKIFLISDAHLGAHTESLENQKQRRLLSFLEHVKIHGDRLFILGDLFDFWFEYRHVIPRYHFAVLQSLSDLTVRGITVDFITGNHDYWAGSFFQDALGITVHADPLDINIHGKRFLLAHGDGLAAKDRGYRLLKRFLRHRVSIFLFRMIHPDLGYGLAKMSSGISRRAGFLDDVEEEYFLYARNRFQEGFDGVVIGHTHLPSIREEDHKTFINLGDWITHFTYGVIENGRCQLLNWKNEAIP